MKVLIVIHTIKHNILPFLHFTVWFTAMVDKSANVSHPVSVYNKFTVQSETVMVMVPGILKCHSASEFIYVHHLTSILQDKFSCVYKSKEVNMRKVKC